MRKFLLSLVAFAGFAGCYVEDGYSAGPAYAAPGYAAPGGYVQPEMVSVGPGVQVVYDYDYPVFFNAGFYWRYDGGFWYSSRWHDRGWGRAYDVPGGIRGIAHPEGYAHYRPAGYVPRGNAGFRGGVGYRGNVGYNGGYRAGANAGYRGPSGGFRTNANGGAGRTYQTRPAASTSHATSHSSSHK
jgi:hypothetical protein